MEIITDEKNKVALIISGIIVMASMNIGLLWSNIENKKYGENIEKRIQEDRVFISTLQEGNALRLPRGVVYENKMNQYYDFGPDGRIDLVKVYTPGIYDGSNIIRSKNELEKFVKEFEDVKRKYSKQNKTKK